VRVSECVCVSEEGGREGGGGGRGADTELKTKTPHVNVGNNQVPSQPSSKASGPAPPPPVDTRSTPQQPQRLTNQHLQVQQRGELPGAGGYNQEGFDEVLTIHSNEDRWETAAEVEEMETEFHQLAENQD